MHFSDPDNGELDVEIDHDEHVEPQQKLQNVNHSQIHRMSGTSVDAVELVRALSASNNDRQNEQVKQLNINIELLRQELQEKRNQSGIIVTINPQLICKIVLILIVLLNSLCNVYLLFFKDDYQCNNSCDTLSSQGFLDASNTINNTHDPTIIPTINTPSTTPSIMPNNMPSDIPTVLPSIVPTDVPSRLPTFIPSTYPTEYVHVANNNYTQMIIDLRIELLSSISLYENSTVWVSFYGATG